jgi:glycerophosphoryl diester phosphodiesterase
MKSALLYLFFFFAFQYCLLPVMGQNQTTRGQENTQLIAHRGGVVNDQIPENSLMAVEEAVKRGYYMVEMDVRLTKDGVLIAHHDKDFKRYYGDDRLAAEMTWEAIEGLTGNLGQKVLKLETVLAHCEGKIQVMVDNKIQGFEKNAFDKILYLLDKYKLREEALMIGTEASTEYFTGKIKLSCSIGQLKENVKRKDFQPGNYYLFAAIIPEADFTWAKEHKVMVVGAVNTWAFESKRIQITPAEVIQNLTAAGVTYFQIDSVFEELFD